MQYTIKNKNLIQFLSKQSFSKRLEEALQQNVCNTKDSLYTGLKMSNEILNSGTVLKIKNMYFKVEITPKVKSPWRQTKGF